MISRVSLHDPRVILHGPRVSMQGSRVSLHDPRISIQGRKVSLQGSRVSLHGSKTNLHGSNLKPHMSRMSLHSPRVSMRGSGWVFKAPDELVRLHGEPPHAAPVSLHGSVWASTASGWAYTTLALVSMKKIIILAMLNWSVLTKKYFLNKNSENLDLQTSSVAYVSIISNFSAKFRMYHDCKRILYKNYPTIHLQRYEMSTSHGSILK